MADITIKIIQAADSFALLTLAELKTSLNIPPTDTSQDAALQELIDRYSDVVSTLCNRVFAQETVRETWRELQGSRVFLSHWPAKEEDIALVEAPSGTVLDPSTYEFEERSGKLSIFTEHPEPIVVSYIGGYILPDEAPPALKQACELLIRQDRALKQQQAVAGVRSISHREARVMYFDPAASAAKSFATLSSGGVGQALQSLLYHYVRFYV
jgi:hypothetical protein